MTLKDTCITAARKLPQPFTTAQLAVAAWQASPEDFGLAGYPHLYPDHNKVVALVCKTLVPGNHVRRIAPGLYESSGPNGSVPQHPDLMVRKLVKTRAYQLWVASDADKLNSLIAKEWWDVGDGRRSGLSEYLKPLDDEDETVRTVQRLNDYLNVKFCKQVQW